MRTSPFEYKKTTKTVKKFQGLSVDLTVQEAADLLEVLGQMIGDTKDELFYKLYLALEDFVNAQPWVPVPTVSANEFTVTAK